MNTESGNTKKSRINPLLIILPLIAATIAVVVVLVLYRNIDEYVFESDAYRTYVGSVQKIKKGSSINHDENNHPILTQDGFSEDVSGLPIYFSDRQAVLMPDTMIYCQPTDLMFGKADYLSEFGFDKNGAIYASRSSEKISMKKGLIYDGNDVFIFLEPMLLSINGYSFELGPFSYVEAVTGNDYIIYDYTTDHYYLEPPTNDVIVSAVSGDYEISLVFDSLTKPDGTMVLLFGDPEKLDSIYEKK